MKANHRFMAAILAVVLAGSAGFAQGMHSGHRDAPFGGMLGMFGDYLDLTDAQRTQIKQIWTKERPTMGPLWQQEKQSHEAMKQLIMSGNFDEAKAQTIAQQASQVESQLMVERARTASQAYQVLTPEQKTKLAQFMAKHEQRMAEHMKAHTSASEPTPNQ